MSGGKLVRDSIPDLIRQSGRHVDVQYLSGKELILALAAKLAEEALEVAEAVDDRQAVVEELADVTEVMFALAASLGIEQQEILDAAEEKALRRGAFKTGAWVALATS